MSTTTETVLIETAQNLRTQDNRCTEAPIFIVQRPRRVHSDDGDGFEWYETDDWEAVDPKKAAELEEHFEIYMEEPKGYTRRAYVTVWEFVTACFTEQGCVNFLALDGHNLRGARIYAHGSYRNEEWRTVREHLLSLAPAEEAPA